MRKFIICSAKFDPAHDTSLPSCLHKQFLITFPTSQCAQLPRPDIQLVISQLTPFAGPGRQWRRSDSNRSGSRPKSHASPATVNCLEAMLARVWNALAALQMRFVG